MIALGATPLETVRLRADSIQYAHPYWDAGSGPSIQGVATAPAPANTILDRAGAIIQDRAGANIESRV